MRPVRGWSNKQINIKTTSALACPELGHLLSPLSCCKRHVHTASALRSFHSSLRKAGLLQVNSIKQIHSGYLALTSHTEHAYTAPDLAEFVYVYSTHVSHVEHIFPTCPGPHSQMSMLSLVMQRCRCR